jgi:hypothetical protein
MRLVHTEEVTSWTRLQRVEMATLQAMHLRHGVTVEQAVQGLSEIITESQQPRNIGQPAELRLMLNIYLNWVYSAQTRLRLEHYAKPHP